MAKKKVKTSAKKIAKAARKASRKAVKKSMAKAPKKTAKKSARKAPVKTAARAKKTRKTTTRLSAKKPSAKRPPTVSAAEAAAVQMEEPLAAPVPAADVRAQTPSTPEPAEAETSGPRFFEPDDLPTAAGPVGEGPFYENDRRDRPFYDTEVSEGNDAADDLNADDLDER